MFARCALWAMLCSVAWLVSCSGSATNDSGTGNVNPKTIALIASTDNPANTLPTSRSIADSYAPCVIEYHIAAFAGDSGARVAKVEIAVDEGAWEVVSGEPQSTGPKAYWEQRIPQAGDLHTAFNETGLHVIDARVTFADGEIIDTMSDIGDGTSLVFAVYSSTGA